MLVPLIIATNKAAETGALPGGLAQWIKVYL